ncbi:GNAT family N-acetyltransferase [Acetilactobacillus jinshanensis]|uniref:GNAT family N-acetyltransferase n=1 Tax=Acetilactobacillus jinshanensis TaxID=1720083 RepID=A0A4P6ZKA7_9LACO|nr:GNAT family N-acetyltransferase [Acetilactobacillus jinshanensis]QBP18088.1 GNAT family N-acetyltransferase [Acetilactobacillus jinshanensis]URL60951.1 GNAT family N-acetyltransferase [uncultured bacterium]
MKLHWHIKTFNQLTLNEFWKIVYLRDKVFIVEQDSPYQEIDKQDRHSYHVFAMNDQQHLIAYARFFKNGDNVSFGRVVIPKEHRGEGIGAELIKRVLNGIKKVYGPTKIVIEAQYYAIGFYKKLGFYTVGKPFRDAGRKHIKMIKD